MRLPTQAYVRHPMGRDLSDLDELDLRRETEPPQAELFVPIVDRELPWHKPAAHTGLWTSNYHPEFGSDWCQWCISEEFRIDRDDPTFDLYTLEPDPAARVYVIDSLRDLIELVDRFPRPDYGEDPITSKFRARRSPYYWAFPSWAAVANEYDAVHLTDRGQWATRLSEPNLYGWDCESTLWMRWAFLAVEHVGPLRVAFASPWWIDDDVEYLDNWRRLREGRQPLHTLYCTGERELERYRRRARRGLHRGARPGVLRPSDRPRRRARAAAGR